MPIQRRVSGWERDAVLTGAQPCLAVSARQCGRPRIIEEPVRPPALLSTRLRTWLLMAIMLPMTRSLVHRLAVSAERRDARSARLLRRADSAVTTVSQRTGRKTRRA
jgi:hypothetical protein